MFWCSKKKKEGPLEQRRLPDDWQCAEDLAPGSYQIDVPAAPSPGCAPAVLSIGVSFLRARTRAWLLPREWPQSGTWIAKRHTRRVRPVATELRDEFPILGGDPVRHTALLAAACLCGASLAMAASWNPDAE
jgi:hypothetical protein